MKRLIALGMVLIVTIACVACGVASSEEDEKTYIANPVKESDAKGFAAATGTEINVPDGATDVKYFVINDKIGEMRFSLPGADNCCIRAEKTDGYEDISGMWYEWDEERNEKATIGECSADIMGHAGDEETIEVMLWYDKTTGIMYSLSVRSADLDGFDITAVAQQAYLTK